MIVESKWLVFIFTLENMIIARMIRQRVQSDDVYELKDII